MIPSRPADFARDYFQIKARGWKSSRLLSKMLLHKPGTESFPSRRELPFIARYVSCCTYLFSGRSYLIRWSVLLELYPLLVGVLIGCKCFHKASLSDGSLEGRTDASWKPDAAPLAGEHVVCLFLFFPRDKSLRRLNLTSDVTDIHHCVVK